MRRWYLFGSVLGILVLVATAIAGASTPSDQGGMADMAGMAEKQQMAQMTPTPANAPGEAPLTVSSLRRLPPLRETAVIRPTDQVRQYELLLTEGMWELVSGTVTEAILINGQVPGPELRATEGDTMEIMVTNNLSEVTSIHWHGLHVPYLQDGVSPINMLPIEPGESFTFRFRASHAGTFIYHAHSLTNEIEQVDRGLYGALIIDPQLPENEPEYDVERTMVLGGWTVDAGGMAGMDEPMEMAMNYNYWTINGKSFPDTEPILVKEGQRVRIRLINISNLAHPMHLHGTDFRVIAEDGHPLPQPRILNTVNVEPGKTYDIDFIANNPGVWVFHCHELHHTTNDDTAPGGLITLIQYEGFTPIGLGELPAGQEPMEMESSMPGMDH